MVKRKKNFFFTNLTSLAFTWSNHTKKDKKKFKQMNRRFAVNKWHTPDFKNLFAKKHFIHLLKTTYSLLTFSFSQTQHKYVSSKSKKESFLKIFIKNLSKDNNYQNIEPKTSSHFKKQKFQILGIPYFRKSTSGKLLKELRKHEPKISGHEIKENLRSSFSEFKKALLSILKLPLIVFYVITSKQGYSLHQIKSKAIVVLKQHSLINRKLYTGEKKEASFFRKIFLIFSMGNKNTFSMLHRRRKAIEESVIKWIDNTTSIIKNEEQRLKFIYTAITSTIVYMLSFFFIYIVYQLATVTVATHFNISSTLFFYGIRWPGPDSILWTLDSVIAIFLAGPFISLLLGFFFLSLFYIFVVKDGYAFLKLFFVWSYIHAFNMFFGAFIVGVITEKGFGYAQDWLYLNATYKYVISTISIFILALIGFFSTSHFLQCSLSYFIIKKGNRILFIISQVFIPWLLGSMLLLLIKIPKNTFHEALIFAPLVFVFIPIFPNHFSFWTARVKLPAKRKELHVERIQIILITIVMIIFRVVLHFGITFR